MFFQHCEKCRRVKKILVMKKMFTFYSYEPLRDIHKLLRTRYGHSPIRGKLGRTLELPRTVGQAFKALSLWFSVGQRHYWMWLRCFKHLTDIQSWGFRWRNGSVQKSIWHSFSHKLLDFRVKIKGKVDKKKDPKYKEHFGKMFQLSSLLEGSKSYGIE